LILNVSDCFFSVKLCLNRGYSLLYVLTSVFQRTFDI